MTTDKHRFVRLLASVTSEAEARLAAAHGADFIDAKNPETGALGALPVAVVSAIRAAVPARLPVSATVGDVPSEPGPMLAAAEAMAASGCDIVKIGLFPGEDAEAAIRHVGRELARRTALVAVLFADLPLDLALVEVLAEAGFQGAMLDTAKKDGRTLRDHRTTAELAEFLRAARASRLMSGLAGSLRLTDVPDLLALSPDVLGFRGALCKGSNRKSALDPDAIAAVRRAIPRASAADTRLNQKSLETTS